MSGRAVGVIGFLRQHWLWLLVAVTALACGCAVFAILSTGPRPVPLPSAGSSSVSATPGELMSTSSPSSPAAPSATAETADVIGASAGGWAEVATGFGRTFTQTTLGQQAWFAAVSSWLTDEQAAMYRDVRVADIPTGTLVDVDVDDPGEATKTRGVLTYDSGMKLDLGLVYAEPAGGWLIASVRLADPSG